MYRQIKTILFDFDGTLSDSGQAMMECANQLADKYHHKKLDNWEHLRTMTTKEIFKQELGLSWYQIPFYIAEGRKLFREKIRSVNLFANIEQLLAALSEHYEVCILSSNNELTIRSILSRHGIRDIKHVIGNIPIHKKRKSIRSFIKQQRQSTNEVIYIGDELRDAVASRKVGIEFIGVSWGLHSKEMFQKQNFNTIVDTPEELGELLLA